MHNYRNFILYLLERFRQDKSIGMIGMVGGNGMPKTGVEECKIIDYFQFYRATVPLMVADRVMSNPLEQTYNGLILGISHAQFGILPECMSMKFANLAFSAQDIYYNLKTLEHCLENYADKVKHVEYIILDMYDYSYFNFDTSMVKWAPRYYLTGGYSKVPHHFDENRNYDYSFEQLMLKILSDKYAGIDDEKITVFDQMFAQVHAYRNYEEFVNVKVISERTGVVNDNDIADYRIDTGIVSKIHEDTIKENKGYFRDLLKLIYQWNPQMKVYCILLPRYMDIQHKTAEAFEPWKKMFYEIMQKMQAEYPFTFLDFNGHEISEKRSCYYDASHFNYYGAVKFTDLLETYLYDETSNLRNLGESAD
jgi:hypothetical protein